MTISDPYGFTSEARQRITGRGSGLIQNKVEMCYKFKSVKKLNSKFIRRQVEETCDTAICLSLFLRREVEGPSWGEVCCYNTGVGSGVSPPRVKCSVSHAEEEAVRQWAVFGRGFKKPTPHPSPNPARCSKRLSSLAVRRLVAQRWAIRGKSRRRVWAARRRRRGAIWGSLCRATASGPSPSRSPGRTAGPWGWLWWCAVAWTAWSRFRWSRRAERPLTPSPRGAKWVKVCFFLNRFGLIYHLQVQSEKSDFIYYYFILVKS